MLRMRTTGTAIGWALLKTALLFIATALAEILGCFLPYLWLRRNGPIWLLLPAAASLALFVWLLTQRTAACTSPPPSSGYAWSMA